MKKLGEAGGHGRFSESYLILKRLGGGGDGTVYLVKHLVTEQLRAAKQIRMEKGRDEYHELQMMKRLHHPSLPEVIDVLEEGGSIWLILEYVKGEVIQSYAGKNLTPDTFFSVAEQLAEVVGYLHSRAYPILHLDIKPSNILIRKNGRIVLIDFGAAVHAGQTRTSEECRGTPGFAAPEQYQSNVRLDGKTDIYGIGAVLFYLLSGSCCPISEDKMDKKYFRTRSGKHGRKPFWRKEADRVVAICLSENPKNRYPDGQALAGALRNAKKRWKRRQKLLPFVGASSLLLILTCFGTLMWLREEQKNTAERQLTAETLMEAAKGLGWEGAYEKYKEVLRLKSDGIPVLLQALDQILDDFRFTVEEERGLQELLLTIPQLEEQTILEKIEEDPEKAGIFSYRLGLAYWYFYDGSGGRSAGAAWFQKAVDFGRKSERKTDWLPSARIYMELSGYYDCLGKREEKEGTERVYVSLWRKLIQLWNSPGFVAEAVQLRAEAAEELLICVVMGAAELYMDDCEVDRILDDLENFLNEEVQDQDKKEQLEEQLKVARISWRRVTGKMQET